MKVLLIDDDPFGTELLRVISRKVRPDWQLLTAREGTEGLKLTQAEAPDVILLDFRLPDMTGADVLKRLRENLPSSNIPVIMLTGDAREESRARMTELGVNGFLVKPFDIDELLARVATLTGG